MPRDIQASQHQYPNEFIVDFYWDSISYVMSIAIVHVEWCVLCRLLHSPSVLSVGLPVGNQYWPLTGRFKYRLENNITALNCGAAIMHRKLTWLMGIFIIFQRLLTVPCTALTAGNLPAVRAVQGECETVQVLCSLSTSIYGLGSFIDSIHK